MIRKNDHCPDLGKNMNLVRESQQYLKDHDNEQGKYSNRSNLYFSYPETNFRRRARDHAAYSWYQSDAAPEKPRDIRYLSLPIETLEDLELAKAEAEDLEGRGEAGAKMAGILRIRIDNAMDEIFGQKLTDTKFKCISVAEELRANAWKCQERGLYDMATKLNERVLAIYQKEVGSVPKTAGVMADLGKIAEIQNNPEVAQDWYARALQIYNNYPLAASAERASFLESFAGFVSRRKQTKISKDLYEQASQVRDKLAKATVRK